LHGPSRNSLLWVEVLNDWRLFIGELDLTNVEDELLGVLCRLLGHPRLLLSRVLVLLR